MIYRWLSIYCIGNNGPNWRTHIFQRGWNHQPADIQLCFFDVYLGWFNDLWYVLILFGWNHFLTQIEMLLKGQSISLPRVMTSSTCWGTMCPFLVDSSERKPQDQPSCFKRGRGIWSKGNIRVILGIGNYLNCHFARTGTPQMLKSIRRERCRAMAIRFIHMAKEWGGR